MRSSGHIGILQSNEWLETIRQCCTYDIYHLPFYSRLSQSRGEGEPTLFWHREQDHVICLPLLVRPVDVVDGSPEQIAKYRDVSSVYGYVGPVTSWPDPPIDVVCRFQESLRRSLEEMNVVSLFTRLHPLVKNERLVNGLGRCKFGGQTVSVDTSQSNEVQYSEFRRNHKADIVKLVKMGVSCSETTDETDIQIFADMYQQAMIRLGAPPSYFYPRRWFSEFLETTQAENRLFLCRLDGVAICGGIVTCCNGLVQIQLAATCSQYLSLSPSKLLFDHIRSWATESGACVLHLGGGVGTKKDSLFHFKSGFSRRHHSFYTWQWIIDKPVYDKLTVQREKLHRQNASSPMEGFFPAYRTPIAVQNSAPGLQVIAGQSGFATGAGKEAHEDRGTRGEPPACLGFAFGHSPKPADSEVRASAATVDTGRANVRIIILGAGGHARVIADAILQRAARHRGIELVGFLDDDQGHANRKIQGKSVLGRICDLKDIPHDAIVIGVGDNQIRRRLFHDLSVKDEKIMTVIHPHATIARDVKMGRGTVVFAGVVVNAGSVIGNDVILNTGSTVDHDCTVKSHAHICPGAHLGGTVRVGEGAFVGIGSTVIQDRTIGAWSTVGGGSAVIRDVPPNTTVAGVPAVVLRKRAEARQTHNEAASSIHL